MSSKKKKSDKRRFTPLEQHKRKGSEVTTLPSDMNIQMLEWERDLMPEHIWIELLAWEYKDRGWFRIYNDFMDKVDAALVEERKTPLLGFMTDFGTLSEPERQKFISDNRDFIYHFFFKPIGRMLTLYPENPANWMLSDEWKANESIDFEIELRRLGTSLSRMIKAKDLYAGHLRSIPLNRLFKHNKILLSNKFNELGTLISKYPVDCSEDEQYRVQQFARLTINNVFMMEERYKSCNWSQYFWRHNYDLVPCRPVEGSLKIGDITDDNQIKELQTRLWENCVILMRYIDKVGMQYRYDLYDPLADEVKLGLFS